MFFLVEIVKELEINGVARPVVLRIQMKFKILVIVDGRGMLKLVI